MSRLSVATLHWDFNNTVEGNLWAQYTTRPAAQVQCSRCKSFVHRYQEIACAEDATFRPESLSHRFAQCDSCIFHGVVLVHIQVAAGDQFKVESAVAGK